jgi:hypothetical protein
MKKIFIAAFSVLSCMIAMAQPNTFPTTGNTGIGTATPQNKLDVVGAIRADITNAPGFVSNSPLGVSIQQANINGDYNIADSYLSIFSHNIHFNGTSWVRRNQYSNSWATVLNHNYYEIKYALSDGNGPANSNVSPASYFRINPNGYVGIGTTAPQAKMHIAGRTIIETDDDDILTFNNNDNSWQYMQFKRSGVRKAWMGLNDQNDFYINRDDGNNIILYGGNIGIGTTSPVTKLHVNGAAFITAGLLLGNTSNDVGYAQQKIDFGGGSNFDALWINRYNAASDFSEMRVNIGDDGNDKFIVGYTSYMDGSYKPAMTVRADGLVAIGGNNFSAGFRLFVEDGIRTRKIKVDQAVWADYVFADDYKLPSLAEVEKFIYNNRHLPGIPSAKTVEKEGLDLGENQAALLKKIEELTLYLIQEKKRNDELEERLKNLEAKIK